MYVEYIDVQDNRYGDLPVMPYLKTSLEGTYHDIIMWPYLGKDAQMYIEYIDVHYNRYSDLPPYLKTSLEGTCHDVIMWSSLG